MYESYFKLKEKPFSISPDPRFIYLTAQHQEALAKVQYAISQRMGVSAIYGDIGAGKTSLARRLWVLYADNPNYNFAMIVHPNFPSTFQFVKEIRREFGLDKPPRSLSDALDEFQDFLLTEHSKGKTNILVIDEAQNLKPSNYETLRQLLNFETNTQKLLQIALFGQNESSRGSFEVILSKRSQGSDGGTNLAKMGRKADRAYTAVGRQALRLTGSPRPPGTGASGES